MVDAPPPSPASTSVLARRPRCPCSWSACHPRPTGRAGCFPGARAVSSPTPGVLTGRGQPGHVPLCFLQQVTRCGGLRSRSKPRTLAALWGPRAGFRGRCPWRGTQIHHVRHPGRQVQVPCQVPGLPLGPRLRPRRPGASSATLREQRGGFWLGENSGVPQPSGRCWRRPRLGPAWVPGLEQAVC